MRSPYRFTLLGVAALALAAAGCSSGSSSSSSGSTNWATVTSASAGGGMSKLVAAAKKEGKLNVIALPPTWANYGTIIKDFKAKYGIKVNSQNPTAAARTRSTRSSGERHRQGALTCWTSEWRSPWPTPACSRRTR